MNRRCVKAGTQRRGIKKAGSWTIMTDRTADAVPRLEYEATKDIPVKDGTIWTFCRREIHSNGGVDACDL
jgi:hypothetical protein